jgi:hypothetical protein
MARNNLSQAAGRLDADRAGRQPPILLKVARPSGNDRQTTNWIKSERACHVYPKSIKPFVEQFDAWLLLLHSNAMTANGKSLGAVQ